jgi:hypothetical protein
VVSWQLWQAARFVVGSVCATAWAEPYVSDAGATFEWQLEHASGPGVLHAIGCGEAPRGKWHATVQLVPPASRTIVPEEGAVPPGKAGALANPKAPPQGWQEAQRIPVAAWRSCAPVPHAGVGAAVTAAVMAPSAPRTRFGSTNGDVVSVPQDASKTVSAAAATRTVNAMGLPPGDGVPPGRRPRAARWGESNRQINTMPPRCGRFQTGGGDSGAPAVIAGKRRMRWVRWDSAPHVRCVRVATGVATRGRDREALGCATDRVEIPAGEAARCFLDPA